MLNRKSFKIVLFLILPVTIAVISFFYNFAGYLFSPGQLTLGHKEFNNSCFKCHMPLVSVSSTCLSCHEATQKSLKNKIGFHGNMDEASAKKCLSCHTEHVGMQRLIVKDSRTRDQYEKDIERIRVKNSLIMNREILAVKPDYLKLWDQIAPEQNWEKRIKAIETQFDHKLTGYPLLGAHAKAKCQDCHKNIKDFAVGDKEGLMPSFSMEKLINKDFCYSCHKKDDQGKKGHQGAFGKNCASCHTMGGSEKGWKALLYNIRNHHDDPKHELVGQHKKTTCQKCHTSIPFKMKTEDSTCFRCHENLDKKIHELSLGKKCESCHTPVSFRKSTFDHQKTKFPLKYTHKKTGCQKCHSQWDEGKQKPKIYKSLANSVCFDCHARDDVHHGTFKNDCARCHKETYWGDVTQR